MLENTFEQTDLTTPADALELSMNDLENVNGAWGFGSCWGGWGGSCWGGWGGSCFGGWGGSCFSCWGGSCFSCWGGSCFSCWSGW